ncbi:glycosyltransferase family 2 protein [Mucilaginibacter sp.]|uniref:glycosyltransferase family 2 protein n=1 Tax=Mucilaginibacter sp. TaxID=1882438 RepID=UPI002845251A|nr:glycosyltransferase family 2 protein [Mucilaginibacter sp.]MDR3696131.1 glycosyltransferase family 2 protein [Mucilaginibacter sp.]
MKVSIVTVNFNQPKVTEEFLASIPAISDVEVIVVDNNSDQEVTPQLQAKYPTVKFIRSDKNRGFAGGNNLGIQHATGDYLFFVNNDTEFTPGLIEKLAGVLDAHPEVGMVSPKIKYFYNKGMIQYAGYTPLNYYTARNSCIGLRENDNGQYDHITAPTAYCHGAAMMVRKAAIEKAGMMNENFFLYYEELDWGENIKRAGYQAWVCTEALIYHKESVSVGKNSRLKEYFINRNRILFIRRNAPFFKKYIFYLYFILLVVPRNVIDYIKAKNYNYIPTLIKAVWWNLTHNKNSKDLGYRLTPR